MTLQLIRISSKRTDIYADGKFLMFTKDSPERVKSTLLSSPFWNKKDKIIIK